MLLKKSKPMYIVLKIKKSNVTLWYRVFLKKNVSQLSKDQEKEVKKLKNKSSGIESKIASLEVEIEKIDLELANNYEEASAKPRFLRFIREKERIRRFNGRLGSS